MYQYVLGWREVLARVFNGFTAQDNVSPTWLVNPHTHRRLKLDIFYPEIGVAVRFVGLLAKGQRRQSDQEAEMDEARNDVRGALCRANNVSLISLSPDDPEVQNGFNSIRSTLAGAARRIAQNTDEARARNRLMATLNTSRETVEQLARQVKKPEDLSNFADLWRDREAALANAAPAPVASSAVKIPQYRVGQAVQHTTFGPGEVRNVTQSNGDVMVTVLFVTAGERTLSARLAGDKLKPR